MKTQTNPVEKEKIENIWKCNKCKKLFSDTEKEMKISDDDRCPKCGVAFSQLPYEAPHEISDYTLWNTKSKTVVEELIEGVMKDFDKQDFCWTDDYDGTRKLHTNDDFTKQVKDFLKSSLTLAFNKGKEEVKNLEEKK